MKSFNFTAYVNKALSVLLTFFILYLVKVYLTPFLIALLFSVLFAALAEPTIRSLCRRGMKRNHSALLVIPILLSLICFTLLFVGTILSHQINQFLNERDGIVQTLSVALTQIHNRLQDTYLGKLSLWEHLKRLLNNLDFSSFIKKATALASALPSLLLGVTFVLLSSFQLAAHRTEIFPFLGRQLSPKTAAAILHLKNFLQHTVLHWLKAQVILFSIVFAILSFGLWLLSIPGWLFIAFVISLLDALPVIGAGMIMLPWALFCFVTGNTTLALELLLVYAIMESVRNLLEPRILSTQLGLSPFVTLCSLYLGFTIMGISGMLLFPLLALSLIKLQEWGYLKLWK